MMRCRGNSAEVRSLVCRSPSRPITRLASFHLQASHALTQLRMLDLLNHLLTHPRTHLVPAQKENRISHTRTSHLRPSPESSIRRWSRIERSRGPICQCPQQTRRPLLDIWFLAGSGIVGFVGFVGFGDVVVFVLRFWGIFDVVSRARESRRDGCGGH